jgi:hypothetical protein
MLYELFSLPWVDIVPFEMD